MASGKKKLCQLFDRKALLRRVLKKDKVLATQEAFQVAKKTLPRPGHVMKAFHSSCL